MQNFDVKELKSFASKGHNQCSVNEYFLDESRDKVMEEAYAYLVSLFK